MNGPAKEPSRTKLGSELRAIRRRIVESGEPLLSAEEIDAKLGRGNAMKGEELERARAILGQMDRDIEELEKTKKELNRSLKLVTGGLLILVVAWLYALVMAFVIRP